MRSIFTSVVSLIVGSAMIGGAVLTVDAAAQIEPPADGRAVAHASEQARVHAGIGARVESRVARAERASLARVTVEVRRQPAAGRPPGDASSRADFRRWWASQSDSTPTRADFRRWWASQSSGTPTRADFRRWWASQASDEPSRPA